MEYEDSKVGERLKLCMPEVKENKWKYTRDTTKGKRLLHSRKGQIRVRETGTHKFSKKGSHNTVTQKFSFISIYRH